jgi:hypothetical protein
MAKILKRTVDALQPEPDRDVFAWDSELKGFGVRVKPSGVKSYLVQYRNVEGRTRRLVLGQHGALTPEVARDLARKKLSAVATGEDPSEDRHTARAGMTLAEVCDWYLKEAEAGRLLGRNRRRIKASTLTLQMDQSRIETHIKPLLGSRTVSGLTLRDVQGMQADIAAGKSARGRKGRGGRATGGAGVSASRRHQDQRLGSGHGRCRQRDRTCSDELQFPADRATWRAGLQLPFRGTAVRQKQSLSDPGLGVLRVHGQEVSKAQASVYAERRAIYGDRGYVVRW